jgi:hypothetical protein
MQNPLKALTYALDKYPEKVAMIPLQELLLESARKNDKRPAFVKLAVPDDVVKELRGGRTDDEKDLVMLVIVPKEIQQRSESLIILPGEVR